MSPPLTRREADTLYAPIGGTSSDPELAAIAGLTSAADTFPYFTGSGTAALGTITAAGRSLVDDASAAAQRTTLGLGTGATVAAVTNLIISASEFIPRGTNGCGVNTLETSTNKVNYDTLDFDASTAEYAQCWKVLPSNWNGGTITAKFHWTAASGSGDVIWGLQARSFANDDAIDQAFGTAQTATDTLTAAADIDISPATSAITVGGTIAAGNPVCFQLYRDATAGGDTLAVDAQFLWVEITYTPA